MNFAGRFADVFRTRTDSGATHARIYLQGLLSKEPAKNMEGTVLLGLREDTKDVQRVS